MELSNVNLQDVAFYSGAALVSMLVLYLVGRLVLSRLFPDPVKIEQPSTALTTVEQEVPSELVAIKTPPPPGYDYDSTDRPCMVCGNLATLPAPVLEVKRRYWFRDPSHYATTPTYRRHVPRLRSFWPWSEKPHNKDVCNACAPACDAVLDRFVLDKIRAPTARHNESIALEVNVFMREGMVNTVREEVNRRRVGAVAAPTVSQSRLPLRAVLPSTPDKATGTE